MKNREKELCLRLTYAEGKAVGIAPVSNLCRRHILCRRLCGRAGLVETYADGPDKKPSAQGLAVGIDPHSCSVCEFAGNRWSFATEPRIVVVFCNFLKRLRSEART